jgi:hypothetical protein
MASYYALLNLFGEFPLIQQHSTAGKVVATITAVIAVAFFAVPAGIIGNGMESVIQKKRLLERRLKLQQDADEALRRLQQESVARVDSSAAESSPLLSLQPPENAISPVSPSRDSNDEGPVTRGFIASYDASDGSTTRDLPGATTPVTLKQFRVYLYNLLHARVERGALVFDHFINILVVVTAVSFAIETVSGLSRLTQVYIDCLEFMAVLIFTVEYAARVFSVKEDPKYINSTQGRWQFVMSFLPVVDLLSIFVSELFRFRYDLPETIRRLTHVPNAALLDRTCLDWRNHSNARAIAVFSVVVGG